jgi:hypothetical protein
MPPANTIETEIEIEYRDFDEYDIDRTTRDATIKRDNVTVTVMADGLKPRFPPLGDETDDDEPLTTKQ